MRRAWAEVSIRGKDVSMDLRPHLLSLSWTDKADDELDDLQLTLEDREGLWQGDWLPQHGELFPPLPHCLIVPTHGKRRSLS